MHKWNNQNERNKKMIKLEKLDRNMIFDKSGSLKSLFLY